MYILIPSSITYLFYQSSNVKVFGTYIMGKLFQSDAKLDGKVYTVTKLLHYYTPSGYEKRGSWYSDNELCNQTIKDRKYDNDGKPRITAFLKLIKQIK